MGLILLPGGQGDTKQYGGREFEPGYQPKSPLCMKCGREGTDRNPVMVTLRPSWSPFAAHDHRHVDAVCYECRSRR